jgi:hypothetical protein
MNTSMGRQRRKLREGIMETSPDYISWCHGKAPNGLRYLRWGGDGEAVQLEK